MTLQRRLLLLISIAAPIVWALTAGLAWQRARHEIDELYDTELVRLARQVSALLPASWPQTPPRRPSSREPGGEAELDLVSIAVWADGRLLLSDAEGAALPFRAGPDGFADIDLDGRRWRVFYLHSNGASERTVAVGQRLDERTEIAEGLLLSQLLPWLAMLPVLLVALAFAVRRALAPMRALGRDVERRDAGDLRPLATDAVPSDLVPLVASINRLLARVEDAIRQERRFTADAAHELRTPIAALRAQWDAARLAADPADRERAAHGVTAGLERLGHLVSQMLALARADAAGPPPDRPIDWREVVERSIADTLPAIDAADAQVSVEWPPEPVAPMPLSGDAALVASMLRNLVDNAVRYGPRGGQVTLRVGADRVVVEDDGPGLDADGLARLGERFHRPDGATAPGSGLGVSIALRVAAAHGLTLRFENRADAGGATGLRATIARAAA